MKKSFTLLELVVVIVVVGIIAIVAIPRFQRDNLQEVGDQILSHIRYTQQLAMMDNKFDPNDTMWYKKRWMIEFSENEFAGKCKFKGKEENCLAYQIYCDNTLSGNLNSPKEVAKDPKNPNLFLSAGWSGNSSNIKNKFSKNLNIQKTFGIGNVEFSKGCSKNKNKTIAFDEIGRPMRKVSTLNNKGAKNSTDRLLKEPCVITLSDDSDENISIAVCNESGYAFILPRDEVKNANEAKDLADKICQGKK